MLDRYALATAAADLAEIGLLKGVRTALNGGWQEIPASAAVGSFHGAVLDSRQAGPGVLFVGLPGSRVHGRQFVPDVLMAAGHALVDRIPDAPPPAAAAGATVLLSSDPLAAMTHLASCWRIRWSGRVVAVTGSNGKTTTKDFLAAILGAAGSVLATRGNFNSAQGVPLTLLDLTSAHRLAVVEMGASAVGHIAARTAIARPEVGVITNASDAHLEEFGSLARVVEGKGELVAGLPASGTAVLNADSPGFSRWCERTEASVVSWGEAAGEHRWSWRPGDTGGPSGWLDLDGEPWPVPLAGRHNAANLVAAILAARALGLEDVTIRDGLARVQTSPHRGRLRRLAGRTVLDDCYNANPASMVAAAETLCSLPGGTAVVVAGAMAELGRDSDALHRRCGEDLARTGVDRLLAVGPGAAGIADGFAAAGGVAERAHDHVAAAAFLADHTQPGDRILLKGSRSAAMEKVFDHLEAIHRWQEESA